MWFEVSKEGLSQLLARRGKGWVVAELIQNAWDENKTTKVVVDLAPIAGRPFCQLSVVDDSPEGFKDLAHSYTLFAQSYKKTDEKKRGRFNLGEKLVLALCQSASISSTTGTIEFNEDGRHNRPRLKRDAGTRFDAVIRMTREEYEEVCKEVERLIPPSNIETVFNGNALPRRTPLVRTTASLMTEVATDDGLLKRVRRDARIDVYEPRSGETGHVYEMGIPVAETGDKYHVDIQMKVPLSMERDSLPESYLREVRAITLNATTHLLTREDAASSWVGDALEDDKVSKEAVVAAMDLRYGKNRVIYDPSDLEANALATVRGYTVVHGGNLSSKQWDNVRAAGAMRPAGQVTPSPKPFSPDGMPLRRLGESEYKPEHRGMANFARWVASKVIMREISVVFANDPQWRFGGAYGPDGTLYINAREARFRGRVDPESFIDFLIHEFGHDMEPNHLSSKYHEALTLVGARTAMALRASPESLGLLYEK